MKTWVGYQKGVNLGGWFSQCDYSEDRFANFIKEEDIKELSTWGIDHLRVPIDYNLVEEDNGEYKESGFAHIDRIVSWCGKYGLNMILDLHKTAGYSFDAGEQESGFFYEEQLQERFYRLWEQLAKRYGKYNDRLAFELLNEVTDISYLEKWKEVSSICIDRIRKIAPDTYILIGGYWNNSVMAVKDLQPPCDDKIVYNFHCYDPLILTHQGAYWIDVMPRDFRISVDNDYKTLYGKADEILGDAFGVIPRMKDMDAKFGADFFRTLFEEAIIVAKERNVALYCGEYGMINLATAEDSLVWYKAINEVFTENGIGRAAWSYKEMDFGLSDEHMSSVIDELKNYL